MRENYSIDPKQSKEDLLRSIYTLQKRNSKKRGHKPPAYSFGEFRDWALNDPEFIEVYNDWVDSGYAQDKRPSCDRIFDNKGYSFDNIKWTTYKENISKSKGQQQKRIAIIDKSGAVVAIFFGISAATRLLRISRESIVNSIKNKTTHNGHYFVELPSNS
jgi:hypothetical protein